MDIHAVEEEFKIFIENSRSGKYHSYKDIPVNIWGMHAWEQISEKQQQELLLPLIQKQIERAKQFMPVYKEGYKNINIKLNSINDFWNLPILIKDSTTHGVGFREKVKVNPYIMAPTDIKEPFFVFNSGGTKGVATPTFITKFDREIESTAFARGYRYEGMKPGDIALTTYNPTHKGGEEIKEAFIINKMTYIPRRTTDDAKQVIETIKRYNVNVLLTVQPSINKGDKENKGGGVDFMSLIEAGQDVIEKQIRTIFLGGYNLIDEAIAWAEAYDKDLVTLLGSSEAIPQATNTAGGLKTRLCKHNNLHILNGPHYVEILKEESGIMVPVKKGEIGILVYTTVARDGTIYLRYFPGDQATLLAKYDECPCGIKSPIITNIKRVDHPEDVLSTGCCIG